MAVSTVGVPTASGLKDAVTDFALGAGGGIASAVSSAVFGSGLIGGLAGAALAGSVVKGTRGTVLATVLGFQAIVGGGQPAQASAPAQEVM